MKSRTFLEYNEQYVKITSRIESDGSVRSLITKKPQEREGLIKFDMF